MKNQDAPERRNPHPELHSPSPDLDLEAKIARAELAVIERDERIRRRGHLIVHRAQRGMLKHAGLGVAATAGGALLAWLFARHHEGPPPRSDPWQGAAREAGFSLAGLLPMVWPFMPHKVRRNVTPGMVSTALAILMPLVSWALGRRRRPARR